MRRVAASTCSNLFAHSIGSFRTCTMLSGWLPATDPPSSRKYMLAWLTPTRSARSTTDRPRAIRAS